MRVHATTHSPSEAFLWQVTAWGIWHRACVKVAFDLLYRDTLLLESCFLGDKLCQYLLSFFLSSFVPMPFFYGILSDLLPVQSFPLSFLLDLFFNKLLLFQNIELLVPPLLLFLFQIFYHFLLLHFVHLFLLLKHLDVMLLLVSLDPLQVLYPLLHLLLGQPPSLDHGLVVLLFHQLLSFLLAFPFFCKHLLLADSAGPQHVKSHLQSVVNLLLRHWVRNQIRYGLVVSVVVCKVVLDVRFFQPF